MTGNRNGLTALLHRNMARGESAAPFSLSSFSRGYHAYIGPIDMIPAAVEKTIPLTPEPLPRYLTICPGLMNRFRSTITTKARLSGPTILSRMLPLLLRASEVLSGTIKKSTAYTKMTTANKRTERGGFLWPCGFGIFSLFKIPTPQRDEGLILQAWRWALIEQGTTHFSQVQIFCPKRPSQQAIGATPP